MICIWEGVYWACRNMQYHGQYIQQLLSSWVEEKVKRGEITEIEDDEDDEPLWTPPVTK
jgi:hypothetical protein